MKSWKDALNDAERTQLGYCRVMVKAYKDKPMYLTTRIELIAKLAELLDQYEKGGV